MMNDINTNFLKIPLYKLYYIDDLNGFSGLTDEELESLKKEYDDLELKGIIESVEWAKKNPDYDFSSLLPNLQYSNNDIYNYLCILETSLVRLGTA